LPLPEVVTSIAKLQLCGTTLKAFAHYYGSTIIVSFVDRVAEFLQSISATEPMTQADIDTTIAWVDNACLLFHNALEMDLKDFGSRHETIHYRLDQYHPELNRKYVTNLKRAAATTSPSSRKRTREEDKFDQAAKKKKHDNDWTNLMPRIDGKQICARFLSATGCKSTRPGKCWDPARVHVIPTMPLPSFLLQKIKSKWDGLCTELTDKTNKVEKA